MAATHTTMIANAEPWWPGKNGLPIHRYNPARQQPEVGTSEEPAAPDAPGNFQRRLRSPAYSSSRMAATPTQLATSAGGYNAAVVGEVPTGIAKYECMFSASKVQLSTSLKTCYSNRHEQGPRPDWNSQGRGERGRGSTRRTF